jgi:hypothetical protein
VRDGLISLIQFDRVFLASILARLRTASGERAYDFALCEMVEAYFWLLLGVELQAFPSRETELMVRQRFTEMFSEWRALFARRGYLFAPSFEDRLRISENQARVVEIPADRQFSQPLRLTSLFHHAVALDGESVSDRELTAFFAGLSVLHRGDLERVLNDGHNLEGVLFVNLNERLLIDAFVQSARHMESFRILDELSRVQPDVHPDDAVLFRSRIRELTRWRLNFRLENVRDFFPEIASRCNASLPDEFRISPADLTSWLGQLIADWGYTHELGIAAT